MKPTILGSEKTTTEPPPSIHPSSPGELPSADLRCETRQAYNRRLAVSMALSFVLNFLLLLLVMTPGFSNLMRFTQKAKPKITREIPQLVLMQRIPEPEKPRQQTFLETDKSQEASQKPKNADFYSEHNTLATQTSPSPIKPGDVPKTDGLSPRELATETVRKPSRPSAPSPPTPPPSPTATTAKPSERPSPPSPPPQPPAPVKPMMEAPKTGDLALFKTPLPTEKPSPPQAPTTEAVPPQKATPPAPPSQPAAPASVAPSTTREVQAVASRLDGGVRRSGSATAFNSDQSPFASYDKKIVAKIGGYWHYLLEGRFYGETVGQGEISFKLLSNGRISETVITRNTANAVLAGYCLQAIERSLPFAPFPESMKALVGDSRDASITFNY